MISSKTPRGLAILIGLLICLPAMAMARTAIDLNPGWKFVRDDVAGAQQSTFDDSGWESIDLPHTWNTVDGSSGGKEYYRGPGWYRKRLQLADKAADLTGKSLFLRFGASSIVTDVYLNGKPAGKHKGAFGAFCFDVTPLVNLSGDNLIAVRVSNAKDEDVPPLDGDFTLYGGIYRSVQLLALDPLSVSPLDDASSGIDVKQTNVSTDSADLQVITQLRNANRGDKTATVKCEVLDTNGSAVQSCSGETKLSAGAFTSSVQQIHLDHPHLWNGRKDPYLYQVRVTISDGANVTDQIAQPLGVRFFHVDPDQGFFLNGQSYPLHGVNRHQDRMGKGWALSAADQAEDYADIQELGCTALRLCHYEHAPEFYDDCDRGGMVVWAELCLVNRVGMTAAFDENAAQQLRELIKQNRNHPSICFWSMYNELGNSRTNGKDQQDHQVQLISHLNQLAHELDPTRLTASATIRPAGHPLNAVTDLLSFNRYNGWYTGKASDWPAMLDKLHAAYPGRAVAISEYGAGGSAFQHELNPRPSAPGGPWHPEEYQCLVHEQAYSALKQRPWLWGTFLWCMNDFASNGRHEGDHPGRNDKGLVTFDRKIKKDVYFFYKANWSSDPFVYITERRFTPRTLSSGPVKIYSNCDSVELKLNGQSLGSKTDADHIFLWPQVDFKPGVNQIEAIGTLAGKQFKDSCAIELKAAGEESH